RDLALLELPKQNNNESILKKYGLINDKYLCLVISGLQYQYCSSEKTYIENWEMIINKISEKYPNKKIVLLAHVFCNGSSDSTMIEKIKNSDNIIKIIEPLLPSEARVILGNAYFTITGRMHAAVSTFQMGKPVISLSYSAKYKGVISDGLDLPELVIEKNAEMWDKFQVSSIVMNKVDYVEEKYSELTEKIENNVESCKLQILNTIKNLMSSIIKG
ncbi:MAG: polysaccharide pyruvyl transferase family protein, partial [Candidatus Cloacimonetes bacterium]|nr:polysaccharide pyruvyl transferase family protein [Candidatus Cloacimonadota bacterium]